ncbi:MAG: HEAT repeat domain-containing protein, partial [bacterium]|nr:HEAT repeat domain-containing protein [bacterium]
MLEDPGDEDARLIESFPELVQVESDPVAYAKHVAQLRRMANHESYAVRMVAVRTLGRARDLDNAPTLIFALTDPDWRVVKEARNGLRFVSRKIDGFGLNEASTGVERESIIRQWKDWYRQIRPNAPRF